MRPMSARRLAFIAFTALSMSCGGGSAKQQGEACVATSQCAQGLLCDQVTRVCSMMGTPVVDAPVAVDASDDDAPTIADAPMVDAPMIDAPPIDAPMVDAPDIDAPDIDAPDA
jgi:ribonuclease E